MVFLSGVSLAGTTDTDPKGKEGKKDSAGVRSEIEQKGFRDLFHSDAYDPAAPYALQINARAVPYIDDYISKHRAHLENMKIWGKPYFRMMDNILAGYGIPRELKYLAVIESNLQHSALSWAGARGPWQFMPETARQLGLVVNAQRDERTDYYKSTHAAARYLKMLYDQLGGDWLLVIAGYNGGPGKVLSAIRRTGSRDFWELQYSLPLESRNHVKKFIATHYVMEGNGGVTTVTNQELASLHAQAIEQNNKGLRNSLVAQQVEGTVTQKIQGKYNSVVLANQLAIDIQQFNKLNPGFDKLVHEEEGYELRLPEEKMPQFNAQRYQILQQSIMTSLQSVTDVAEGFPDPKKVPAVPAASPVPPKRK